MHNAYFAFSPYTDDDLAEPISLSFFLLFFKKRDWEG